MRYLIAGLVLLLVSGCGSGGGGTVTVPPPPPPPSFPYPVGTSWAYSHVQGGGQGVLTGTYNGQQTYRGMQLHRIDASSTLLPGYVERTFFQWATCAQVKAKVLIFSTPNAPGTIEIVFDQTWSTVCGVSRSGTDELYLNGVFQGNGPWAVTSADAGLFTAIVPSGTYTARGWNFTTAFGSLTDVGRDYVVTNKVSVAVDGTANGTSVYQYRHLSGPASTLSVPSATTPQRVPESGQALSAVTGGPALMYLFRSLGEVKALLR